MPHVTVSWIARQIQIMDACVVRWTSSKSFNEFFETHRVEGKLEVKELYLNRLVDVCLNRCAIYELVKDMIYSILSTWMLLNVFTLRSFPRFPPFDRFEKIWRFNIYFFQMRCLNKSVNVHISCISCSDFSATYFHISLFLQKSFVEVSGLLLKEMGPSYNNLTFQISSLRNWNLWHV